MTSTTVQEMKFRNKFQNWLSKTGVPEAIVAMAFTIAMKMDEDSFFWLLWKLSFDVCREKSLNKLGLTTDETSTEEDLEFIPNELVQPLRNELRYQYQQVHEKFLSGYDSEEELYNTTEKDIIFTAGIIKRLYKYIKTHGNVDVRNKVIFLLQSSKENFVFGGLKELGFSNAEATVLSPMAGVIASIFKKMVARDDEYKMHRASIGKTMTSKPFAKLENLIDISTLSDVPAKTEGTQETEEESTCQLSAETVLANIELFKQFFDIVDKFDAVGIDPFEALEKEIEIQALVSSLEALS